jgi:hypothetical protein
MKHRGEEEKILSIDNGDFDLLTASDGFFKARSGIQSPESAAQYDPRVFALMAIRAPAKNRRESGCEKWVIGFSYRG